MPSADAEAAAAASSHVTERRQPLKKKARFSASSSKSGTPNAYARRSPPRESAKRDRSPSPIRSDSDNDSKNASASTSHSPPRKLKRPGAGARIGASNRDAAEAARRRREEEDRKAAAAERQPTRAVDLVASHYNAVPERGREWRKKESKIGGLRSLNNWVKSTLIQKFSRPDVPVQHLLVLDMACGKGGDLGKWEKAPQVPSLYLGCDIADVSIHQARERFEQTQRQRRRGGGNRYGQQPAAPMEAEFYVQDSFGGSLGNIQTVRQVGFNPHAGPGSGAIQPGMMAGGFDVVSIMFALHYSYESEELARGMLKNVAGALKKGGRFIGVMPNSDVITSMVKRLLLAESTGKTPNGKASAEPKEGGEEGELNEDEDDWDPEKPSEANGTAAVNGDIDEDDDWDPEKPSEPPTNHTNNVNDEDDDDWDPTKPSEPNASTTPDPASATPAQQPTSTPHHDPTLPPLEWGNSLYTIRFPRSQPLVQHQPLPRDGVFRPPYGWRYHYTLEEAVDVPEYVVPWEAFRALAEEYGLELLYRKGFQEVLEDEAGDRDLGMLAERMGVLSRDRTEGRVSGGLQGLLVGEEEMEAAAFYHAFCFYKT